MNDALHVCCRILGCQIWLTGEILTQSGVRDSQNGRSQSLLLVQPLRLPQFEDLAVVESVDFVLEQLQGGGLAGQRPGDLLPHHLHHLGGDAERNVTYRLSSAPCSFAVLALERNTSVHARCSCGIENKLV